MGLNSLRLEKWIEVDEYFYRELQEKERLLEDNYSEVFSSNFGSSDAQYEVLELLLVHMHDYFPGLLEERGDEIFIKDLDRAYSKNDFNGIRLDLCGRLIQEDLCLMAPGENGYTLEAASLCFPSRWRLLDKMGLPMGEIHNPVPEFSEKLGRPVDRFFDRLAVDNPVWRVNWSLTSDPELYQPVRGKSEEQNISINAKNAGKQIFIRCERQTLRRLPETGWILFTIKTYLDEVSKLLDFPDAAKHLACLLRDLPRAVLVYKNILPFLNPLLAYLDSIGNVRNTIEKGY